MVERVGFATSDGSSVGVGGGMGVWVSAVEVGDGVGVYWGGWYCCVLPQAAKVKMKANNIEIVMIVRIFGLISYFMAFLLY